ncbi:hypothetical protein J6590_036791 [Homalodisca vitripennis]|nr:hypothetical protein J6590_036791 [Homalodisca vitripennis]
MRLSRKDSDETSVTSKKQFPHSHCIPESNPTYQTYVRRVGRYKDIVQKLKERMLVCERTLAGIEGKLDDMHQVCQKWRK